MVRVGFDGPLIHILSSIEVVANDPQKIGIVTENIGMVGVNCNGLFVHFFSPATVVKYVNEEKNVKIE